MESAAVPVGSQATARTFDDDNSDDGVVAAIIEVYYLLHGRSMGMGIGLE